MYKQQKKRLPPITTMFRDRTGHDTMEVFNPLQGRTETLTPLTIKSLLHFGNDIFFLARILGDTVVRKDSVAAKKAGSMLIKRWSPRFDRGLLDIEFDADREFVAENKFRPCLISLLISLLEFMAVSTQHEDIRVRIIELVQRLGDLI